MDQFSISDHCLLGHELARSGWSLSAHLDFWTLWVSDTVTQKPQFLLTHKSLVLTGTTSAAFEPSATLVATHELRRVTLIPAASRCLLGTNCLLKRTWRWSRGEMGENKYWSLRTLGDQPLSPRCTRGSTSPPRHWKYSVSMFSESVSSLFRSLEAVKLKD